MAIPTGPGVDTRGYALTAEATRTLVEAESGDPADQRVLVTGEAASAATADRIVLDPAGHAKLTEEAVVHEATPQRVVFETYTAAIFRGYFAEDPDEPTWLAGYWYWNTRRRTPRVLVDLDPVSQGEQLGWTDAALTDLIPGAGQYLGPYPSDEAAAPDVTAVGDVYYLYTGFVALRRARSITPGSGEVQGHVYNRLADSHDVDALGRRTSEEAAAREQADTSLDGRVAAIETGTPLKRLGYDASGDLAEFDPGGAGGFAALESILLPAKNSPSIARRATGTTTWTLAEIRTVAADFQVPSDDYLLAAHLSDHSEFSVVHVAWDDVDDEVDVVIRNINGETRGDVFAGRVTLTVLRGAEARNPDIEQRVLRGVAASANTVGDLILREEHAFVTKSYPIAETQATSNFSPYQDPNLLGVFSAEPAPTGVGRTPGKFYFNSSHLTFRTLRAAPMGGIGYWEDSTPVPLVPGVKYGSDALAQVHVTADGQVYLAIDNTLRISSGYVAARSAHKGYRGARLLEAGEVSTTAFGDAFEGAGSEGDPVEIVLDNRDLVIGNIAAQGQPPRAAIQIEPSLRRMIGTGGTLGTAIPPGVHQLPVDGPVGLYNLTEETVHLAAEHHFAFLTSGANTNDGQQGYYGVSSLNNAGDPPVLERNAGDAARNLHTLTSGLGAIYYHDGMMHVWVDESKGVPTALRLSSYTRPDFPDSSSLGPTGLQTMPLVRTSGTFVADGVTYRRYQAVPLGAYTSFVGVWDIIRDNRTLLWGSILFGTGENTQFLQDDGTLSQAQRTPVGIYYRDEHGDYYLVNIGPNPPAVSQLSPIAPTGVYNLIADSFVETSEQFFRINTTRAEAGVNDFYGISAINNAGNPPILERAAGDASARLNTPSSGLAAIYYRDGKIHVWMRDDQGDMTALHLNSFIGGTSSLGPAGNQVMPADRTADTYATGGETFRRFEVTPQGAYTNVLGAWQAMADWRTGTLAAGIHFGADSYLNRDGTKTDPMATPAGLYYKPPTGDYLRIQTGPDSPSGAGLTPEQAAELAANTAARHQMQTLDGLFMLDPAVLVADASDILIDGAGGATETDAQVTPWNIAGEQAGVNTSEIRVDYDVRWAGGITEAPVTMRVALQRNVGVSAQVPSGWAMVGAVPIRPVGVGTATFNGPFAVGQYRLAVQTVISVRGPFRATLAIGEIAYLANPAKAGDYIGPYVHEQVAGETTRAAIVEERLQTDINAANARKAIVDSLPVPTSTRKTAIVWKANPPYEQTEADAFQVPATGFVQFILGNLGATPIMPAAYCINRQMNGIYTYGTDLVGLEFDSQRRAILVAQRGGGRSPLANDIANTTTGYVMLHWDVARPDGTSEGEVVGSAFHLHTDVAAELTAPDGADRLLVSDESDVGAPNKWLSLTRLLHWIQGRISISADKVTSGVFATTRIPGLAASKITSGVLATARLGTGVANATKVLYGDGTWKDAPSAVSKDFVLVGSENVAVTTADRFTITNIDIPDDASFGLLTIGNEFSDDVLLLSLTLLRTKTVVAANDLFRTQTGANGISLYFRNAGSGVAYVRIGRTSSGKFAFTSDKDTLDPMPLSIYKYA